MENQYPVPSESRQEAEKLYNFLQNSSAKLFGERANIFKDLDFRALTTANLELYLATTKKSRRGEEITKGLTALANALTKKSVFKLRGISE